MGTILLVESLDIMRDAMARTLVRADFEVLQASSGPSALALLEAYPQDVDLLVTEVVLGSEMSGVDLSFLVKEDRPRIRVLYVSAKRTSGMSDLFLAKPFGLDEFTRRVGKVLNRRARERRSLAQPGTEVQPSERRQG